MATSESPRLEGRTISISPALTTKNGTSVWPSSTRTSPRVIGRVTPWEATRAICAGVSVGNMSDALAALMRGVERRVPVTDAALPVDTSGRLNRRLRAGRDRMAFRGVTRPWRRHGVCHDWRRRPVFRAPPEPRTNAWYRGRQERSTLSQGLRVATIASEKTGPADAYRLRTSELIAGFGTGCAKRAWRRRGARPARAARAERAGRGKTRPSLAAVSRAVPGRARHPAARRHRHLRGALGRRARRGAALRSARDPGRRAAQRDDGLRPGVARRGRRRGAAGDVGGRGVGDPRAASAEAFPRRRSFPATSSSSRKATRSRPMAG